MAELVRRHSRPCISQKPHESVDLLLGRRQWNLGVLFDTEAAKEREDHVAEKPGIGYAWRFCFDVAR